MVVWRERGRCVGMEDGGMGGVVKEELVLRGPMCTPPLPLPPECKVSDGEVGYTKGIQGMGGDSEEWVWSN